MWPSWINTLSWWQWSVLALVPPAIIILYFLKLKRRPVEVPSTYLWMRSIEDLHVNSIWQRLRRNVLLWLQLLFLFLAMLALLRPGWQGEALSGDRLIFLVDNSASMRAGDVDPTRLEEAKRLVQESIDAMRGGDVAMIISFSDTARVEQTFTDNRRLLERAVAGIKPTNRPTSLIEALKVASGLANPGRSAYDIRDTQVAEALPATIYIFSDGRFENVTGFSLGNLTPVYVPVGKESASNVGILNFSIRRDEARENRLQAFAQLENLGAKPLSVTADLFLDGRLVNTGKADLDPGAGQPMVFDLGAIPAGTLKLEVQVDDDLTVDNQAWAVINPPREARVLLITPGNDSLAIALTAGSGARAAKVTLESPSFLDSKQYAKAAEEGQFDLIIYDRCRPKTMPQANTFFLGALPPEGEWKAEPKVDVPAIIDTDPSHPLMHWVNMGDVLLLEGTPLAVPPGGTVLIDSNAGPMMVIAPRDAFEDVVSGFLLVEEGEKGLEGRTTWFARQSFPVFMLNLIGYLGGGTAGQGKELALRPGQSFALDVAASADQVAILSPGGKRLEPRQVGPGRFLFTDTGELGVYEAQASGKQLTQFAVNLFDATESSVEPRKTFDVGPVEVKGRTGWEAVRRELWWWLVWVGLAVLLIEWYIYTRRVYL
ncbi:MAG: BatA and WFA domain-containing protein [Pirellulales bacterium]|nr:BatA and WFA domain-containing protein [Pirellulales bacterium]